MLKQRNRIIITYFILHNIMYEHYCALLPQIWELSTCQQIPNSPLFPNAVSSEVFLIDADLLTRPLTYPRQNAATHHPKEVLSKKSDKIWWKWNSLGFPKWRRSKTLSSLYRRQNAPYDLELPNPIPLTLYTMQCVVHVEKLSHFLTTHARSCDVNNVPVLRIKQVFKTDNN